MTKTTLKKILTFGISTIVITSAVILAVFYYNLKKGQILISNSDSFVFDVLLIALILIAIVCIVSIIVSVKITKSIVSPIEELGKYLDDVDNIDCYDELKPFVNALKEQKKKQKALDRQKKQFTANVSHELKTPLTSIAGYAELIETGMAKPEDVKPFATVIRKQALRLVSLSEDIIKLSQLEENDDKEISFESVDLFDIANRCVEALSINAINKNVTLTLEGESCFIKGKPNLIEELIYNLCDNAIRYNKDNGSVNVSVYKNENGTTLTVKDTGIGIPEKYQDRIFERFFRVDKSRSKATGGTGLGLAIVKHIAQLHSAEITLNSTQNIGTEIIVLFKK